MVECIDLFMKQKLAIIALGGAVLGGIFFVWMSTSGPDTSAIGGFERVIR